MKIVFYSPGKKVQPWLDSLATNLPAAEIWAWSSQCAGRQADYAVVWAPPAELFAQQQNLKAVINIGAGADRVLRIADADALLRDIPVVRLNDAGMAVQMAEYVCHALIRHTREFAAYEGYQRDKKWKTLPALDRTNWPVGVMGLGAIGARVADAIACFEFPVNGWSRTPKGLTGITTYAGAEQLDEFLAATRVLVCVLPLTLATEGILNARTLGALKPKGILINVARGEHLIERDLLALLAKGHLAGATLDVFRDEPLPPGHAFWDHPLITVTPHVAAITLVAESAAQIAQKIRAMERGQPVDGVVERSRGY